MALDLIPSDGAPIMIPAIGADGAEFAIEKMAAHRLGQLHHAVSVFVFCGDRLLIQQRALSKYHCGGQWANTCCSHPHWGEDATEAAHRRLEEELGLRLPLRQIGTVDYRADVTAGLVEHERVAVFRADVGGEGLSLALNAGEVMATRWATREALAVEATQRPEEFAPWFRIYLSRWAELGL